MASGRTIPPLKALTVAERTAAAHQFRNQLAVHSLIDAYWLPSERRVVTRPVATRTGRRLNALPGGEIYIGRFKSPFTGSQFVADLDDYLASEAP